jgi:hypothetical protein
MQQSTKCDKRERKERAHEYMCKETGQLEQEMPQERKKEKERERECVCNQNAERTRNEQNKVNRNAANLKEVLEFGFLVDNGQQFL